MLCKDASGLARAERIWTTSIFPKASRFYHIYKKNAPKQTANIQCEGQQIRMISYCFNLCAVSDLRNMMKIAIIEYNRTLTKLLRGVK